MKLSFFSLLFSAQASVFLQSQNTGNDRQQVISRLREISSNVTVTTDASAFLFMTFRQAKVHNQHHDYHDFQANNF
jgi:hypothetical protein